MATVKPRGKPGIGDLGTARLSRNFLPSFISHRKFISSSSLIRSLAE